MSIFIWACDMACHNALCVLKELIPSSKLTMRQFKRQLILQLTKPFVQQLAPQVSKVNWKRKQQHADGILGIDPTDHFLIMENKSK